MNILIKEHREMLLMLIKHKVEFMLIGGYAVIYYGYGRTTNDMDIWLKPDNANKAKLLDALKETGIIDAHIKKLSKINLTKPTVFFLGEVPYKIDFLTKVRGVNWDEAIEKVKYLEIENAMIPIIYYHHLITTKMLADRQQDKADIEKLQKINKHRKLPLD